MYVFKKEKYSVYLPENDKLLIQKDGRSFELSLLLNHKISELRIDYNLLARDFNKVGQLIIHVKPELKRNFKLIDVEFESRRREDEIVIEDYRVEVRRDNDR